MLLSLSRISSIAPKALAWVGQTLLSRFTGTVSRICAIISSTDGTSSTTRSTTSARMFATIALAILMFIPPTTRHLCPPSNRPNSINNSKRSHKLHRRSRVVVRAIHSRHGLPQGAHSNRVSRTSSNRSHHLKRVPASRRRPPGLEDLDRVSSLQARKVLPMHLRRVASHMLNQHGRPLAMHSPLEGSTRRPGSNKHPVRKALNLQASLAGRSRPADKANSTGSLPSMLVPAMDRSSRPAVVLHNSLHRLQVPLHTDKHNNGLRPRTSRHRHRLSPHLSHSTRHTMRLLLVPCQQAEPILASNIKRRMNIRPTILRQDLKPVGLTTMLALAEVSVGLETPTAPVGREA